ncbi:MAG: 30S ribosomal protein S20 [Candidatus Promineifilaceae bacterium]
MANIQSAKKRIRQNEKRRLHNRRYTAAARTHIKAARKLIEVGELEKAEEVVRIACKTLDKSARRGVIHSGNASRRKGRLMSALAKAKAAAA